RGRAGRARGLAAADAGTLPGLAAARPRRRGRPGGVDGATEPLGPEGPPGIARGGTGARLAVRGGGVGAADGVAVRDGGGHGGGVGGTIPVARGRGDGSARLERKAGPGPDAWQEGEEGGEGTGRGAGGVQPGQPGAAG